jgi:mono/diheme cytochrome c family protein
MSIPSLGLAVLLAFGAPSAGESAKLATSARMILQKHCSSCHGSGASPKADLNVLDYSQLTNPERSLVVPNNTEKSELFQLVACGSMPPGTARKVSDADRMVLQDWIAAGAPNFPPSFGEPYILARIQEDATRLGPQALANVRYVSLNHLLSDPDTAKDIDAYRAALIKALNLLSWKERLVIPSAIDPDNTIFRIRLDELGWDNRPFLADPKAAAGSNADPTRVSLYDLLLLEYPYATPPDSSPASKALVESYLRPAGQVRPVPYIRGDWLVVSATEGPLYNELLSLPPTLQNLEKKLGVGLTPRTRAGVTTSKYIRANRILEQGSSNSTVYWRTYELSGPTGLLGLSKVCTDQDPAHGASMAVFSLPNGLPGFYVGDDKDRRLDAVPPKLLADDWKARGLRVGRACMSCHATGLEPFRDEVGQRAGSTSDRDKIAKMYPSLEKPFAEDKARFVSALAKLPQAIVGDPLQFVVSRMAKVPVTGVPPLDGLTFPQHEQRDGGIKVELSALDGNNRPTEIFRLGDKIAFRLKNTGTGDVYYQLIATKTDGSKVQYWINEKNEPRLVNPGENPKLLLKAGEEITTRQGTVNPPLGQEVLTVYAARTEIPRPVPLKLSGDKAPTRFFHPLYEIDGEVVRPVFDPASVVKKTIVFETVDGKDK